MDSNGFRDVVRSRVIKPLAYGASLLAALLLIASSGLSQKPPVASMARPPADGQPETAQKDWVSMAELAASELAQFKDGVTPAEWAQAHPEDEVTVYDDAELDDGRWGACATRREFLPDGREFVRYAVFDSPEAPSPAVLPPEGDGRQMIMTGCLLRMMRIEMKDPNLDRCLRLAADTQQAIAQKFGQSDGHSESHYADGRWWSTNASWQAGRLSISSSYRPDPNRADNRGVEVYANWLPESHDTGAEQGAGSDLEIDSIEQMVALAGLDRSPIGPQLAELLKAKEWAEQRFRAEAMSEAAEQEASFLSALEHWITAAHQLEPRQQAAALMIANRVLEGSQPAILVGENDGSAARQQLAALGAEFKETHYGYVYTQGWLKEAARLVPEGPLGDSALIQLMDRGFGQVAECAEGGDGAFRRVIEEGERYLLRATDQKLIANVHFTVADAYKDIVYLAREHGQEANQYRAEADQARRKAIEHYRAGLARDSTSPAAKGAWGTAWRLMAGLPPRGGRFTCGDGC